MKVGFIDYYLDEWHANNYPRMLDEVGGGRFQVAYAYGQIPSPVSKMTSGQWCERHGVSLCETIEEVVEKSEALIVLSPDNCEQHEALCQIPLSSQKRTYVDKTFAPDKRSAEAIFERAEKYGTPCYSASALRFAAEYQPFAGKEVEAVSTIGPNDLETYGIHQLEPLVMLMHGSAKRVMSMPWGKGVQLMFDWSDGRSGSVLCTGGDAPFLTTVSDRTECQTLSIVSDYFSVFMQHLAQFFTDGTIPVSHGETIAIMALREAALKAEQTPGSWVAV